MESLTEVFRLPSLLAERYAVLAASLDMLCDAHEKSEKSCKECPFFMEVVKKLKLAMLQETESMTEEMKTYYAL